MVLKIAIDTVLTRVNYDNTSLCFSDIDEFVPTATFAIWFKRMESGKPEVQGMTHILPETSRKTSFLFVPIITKKILLT